MANVHKHTWETYVHSWQAPSSEAKRALYAQCLASDCEYADPLRTTRGWDELLAYMADFHSQLPGAHFVTTEFLSHSNQSVARWNMCSPDGAVLGTGISHGRYTADGKLAAMTGFFTVPESA